MKRLLANIVVGFAALYSANLLLSGVLVEGSFSEQVKVIFFAGIGLGLVNFFIKPIVNLLTFPLRLITFGLFGLVVNMAMVWIIDVFFKELSIEGLGALFWTGLIVWILSLFAGRRKKPKLTKETS